MYEKKCAVRSFPLNSAAKLASLLFSTLLLILGVFLTTNVNAQPQEKEISGVITESETGIPIPGVSVGIKGTSRGTASDLDGNFTLTLKDDDVIVASFIGFNSQEIAVFGKSEILIQLEQKVSVFDEVVVVGYGVQKKKLVTGATIQVDGENLQKRNTTSALQAMQGQTPGVQITSTSGQPSEGLKVVVRGLGTIGNAGPLYVVDGVQTGDISYLNNDDIESIDVLKNAASAAI